MRRLLVFLLALGTMTLLAPHSVSALSLQLRPLEVKTTIPSGETQKGYVDISNPSAQSITVKTYVSAFLQVNDAGDLEFYNDPEVQAGITPDFSQLTIGSHEAYRLYYVLNGAKLPSGNVFAVLFFETTSPSVNNGVTPALRVGTLFSIVNGTPSEHSATITGLSVPFWQLGGKVEGAYTVKNTGKAINSTGFYPEVAIDISPLDQRQNVASSLVFAGRERQTDFSVTTGRFGFYKVRASFEGSTRETWIFVATPWQLVLVLLVLSGLIVGGVRYIKTARPMRLSSHTKHVSRR